VKLKDLNPIFLDVQTTGPNPTAGTLLEMAWNRISGETVGFVLQQDLSGIPKRIRELTGLSDEEIQSGFPTEFVRQKLLDDLAGRSFAVIHYARFEFPFLQSFLPKTSHFKLFALTRS